MTSKLMPMLRLITVVGLLGTTVLTTAGDWPTYLHDSQRTAASPDETALSRANVGQLARLWTFHTGGMVAASAAVVNNTVYVGSGDGYEYALDAVTGALEWKTYLGVTVNGCSTEGVISSATAQNGVVYVGGGDANWYALDAITGRILWSVPVGNDSNTYYNYSSPLLYNGFAYIGVGEGDCPLGQGRLLQVNLATHQIVHTFDVVPNGQVGGSIWSSPAVDASTNTIYITTGNEGQDLSTQPYAEAIVALDASTLAVKGSWQVPADELTYDSDFGATPTIFDDMAGDPLIAVANKNGYLYALNRMNLAAGPIWQRQIARPGDSPENGDGSISPAAFSDGTLYAAGGTTTINGVRFPGAVRAIDPVTGNLLWEHGAPGIVMAPLAYANGLVIDDAGTTLEILDAQTGTRLYSYKAGDTDGNILYGGPSISNGRIFVGAGDGTIYAFGLPTSSTTTPDPNCPTDWSCQDIGNPSQAGSETITGSTWSVTSIGAGIGGSNDQFRFVNHGITGDAQITAELEPPSESRTLASETTASTSTAAESAAQAGLMVRQTLDPASPYYAVLLAPDHQLTVQYRTSFGGNTTTSVQLPGSSSPLYLEIQRVGDWLQAATSTDGVSYALVPGSETNVTMPASATVGLVATSAPDGSAGAAAFSNVTVGTPSTPAIYPPCPSTWNCGDIGATGAMGSQILSGGTWIVQGTAQDILEDTTDQLHFVWQPLTGDGMVSARVISQTATGGWARAGVMLRQSADPDSPYYMVAALQPPRGIAVQFRPNTGGLSWIQVAIPGAAPAYLRVARSGTTFMAYTSNDGTTWTPIPGSSVTFSMDNTMLAGLVVTSGAASFDTTSLATATSTPIPTATNTASAVPTETDTPSPTPTGTSIPIVPTSIATKTPSPTNAAINTPATTSVATSIASPTSTVTSMLIPTSTATCTPSVTPVATGRATATSTTTSMPPATPTEEHAPTFTATATCTPSPTSTPPGTPSVVVRKPAHSSPPRLHLSVSVNPTILRPGDAFTVHIRGDKKVSIRAMLTYGHDRQLLEERRTDRKGNLTLRLRAPMIALRRGHGTAVLRVTATARARQISRSTRLRLSNMILTVSKVRVQSCAQKVSLSIHLAYIAMARIRLTVSNGRQRWYQATIRTDRNGHTPNRRIVFSYRSSHGQALRILIRAAGQRGSIRQTEQLQFTQTAAAKCQSGGKA